MIGDITYCNERFHKIMWDIISEIGYAWVCTGDIEHTKLEISDMSYMVSPQMIGKLRQQGGLGASLYGQYIYSWFHL